MADIAPRKIADRALDVSHRSRRFWAGTGLLLLGIGSIIVAVAVQHDFETIGPEGLYYLYRDKYYLFLAAMIGGYGLGGLGLVGGVAVHAWRLVGRA